MAIPDGLKKIIKSTYEIAMFAEHKQIMKKNWLFHMTL